MFDSIAPSEMMLVLIVALAVIGPKDLPKAMRFVGHWVGKARGMARHFRAGIDTMMREAELEELEKQWRAHNEAIMRNYPGFDPFKTPDPKPAASAPDGAPPPDMTPQTTPDMAGAGAQPMLPLPIGPAADSPPVDAAPPPSGDKA